MLSASVYLLKPDPKALDLVSHEEKKKRAGALQTRVICSRIGTFLSHIVLRRALPLSMGEKRFHSAELPSLQK